MIKQILANAIPATAEQIAEAQDYQTGAFASDLEWHQVTDYPLSRICDLPNQEWFEKEQKDHQWIIAEQGLSGNFYDDMLSLPIREPIIIYDNGKQGFIWDGWHRAAATNVKGSQTIQAIVGIKP